ncbi:unnamed protein product [Boreogadus saida]
MDRKLIHTDRKFRNRDVCPRDQKGAGCEAVFYRLSSHQPTGLSPAYWSVNILVSLQHILVRLRHTGLSPTAPMVIREEVRGDTSEGLYLSLWRSLVRSTPPPILSETPHPDCSPTSRLSPCVADSAVEGLQPEIGASAGGCEEPKGLEAPGGYEGGPMASRRPAPGGCEGPPVSRPLEAVRAPGGCEGGPMASRPLEAVRAPGGCEGGLMAPGGFEGGPMASRLLEAVRAPRSRGPWRL